MKDEKKLISTEQFAVEEEEKEKQWQKQYGEKMPVVVEHMNRLLEQGTKESRWKLYDMFQDKSFFEPYKQISTIAKMYVITYIYIKETEAGIEPCILDQGKDVAELLCYLDTLKFILYRIDFEIDQESKQELLKFMKEHNTSTVTLESLMVTVVMRPLRTSLVLEKLFKENHMYKELLVIQNFINKVWPGNYRVSVELAELYVRAGHPRNAGEYLRQIPHYPENICGKQQRIFEIQEKLWKLRYSEKEACTELLKEISEKEMTEEAWKYFLKNEPSQKVEYYLQLAEEMMGHGMNELAWNTLIYAECLFPGSEEILCLMAVLCVNNGNLEKAVDCLQQVKDPKDMTQKLMKICQKKMR